MQWCSELVVQTTIDQIGRRVGHHVSKLASVGLVRLVHERDLKTGDHCGTNFERQLEALRANERVFVANEQEMGRLRSDCTL